MFTWMRNRAKTLIVMLTTLCISLMASPVLAAGELDTAIEDGFGKLIKYGRWGAALGLAIYFVLGWAARGQNSENPHEQGKATRQMIWAGVGFVVVIGYQLVLKGLVSWFNIDENAIPSFLWQ